VTVRQEFGTGLRARLDAGTDDEGVGVLEGDDGVAALIALLPAQTAYLFNVLPIGFVGDRPLVALSDPTDELGMDCVRHILGDDVEFVPASEAEILSGLARAYGLEILDPLDAT
jgi:Type II secretion system (T2SS), protein E, N-terminal domain